MKKLALLVCLIVNLFACNFVLAADVVWDSQASLNRVNAVGKRLLQENKLPSAITFKVSDNSEINAYANINKEIYVYKGLLEYVENDEELAAIVAHEIAHIVNCHNEKQTIINTIVANINPKISSSIASTSLSAAKQLSLLKVSRVDEFEADLTGVDLLVGAKYNPLALVSVLHKITGNYLDVLQSHPSGEKRILNVYDYISFNYPDEIKKGYTTQSYKDSLIYIEPTVKARNENPKKLAQFDKTQAKLRDAKLKRAKKMQSESSPWSASYAVIRVLSGN